MGNNAAQWDKAAKLLQEYITQQSNGTEAEAVLARARDLINRLNELPTPPKAVWKKLVQQLQVPLQLGAAFASATQHDWASPVSVAALIAVEVLLRKAGEAGIISSTGSGSGSLRSSIRQQLQQSDLLQQLGPAMAALAANLQEQDATLAAEGWEAAGVELDQWVAHASGQLFNYVAGLHSLLRDLWGLQAQPADVNDDDVAWLWGPEGHAVPALQLSTAALQHISCIAQHVLPAVREHAPQQAGELLAGLQSNAELARGLSSSILEPPLQQHSQGGGGAAVQLLLASPHLLPCAAAVLVLCFAYVSRAVAPGSAPLEHSSGVGSSNRTQPGSSSSGPGTGQQFAHPGGSSSSGVGMDTPLTACQLQLLQLLGLDPELTAWPCDLQTAFKQLGTAVCACWGRCSVQASEQQEGQQPQSVEGQLRLLLPTVLLPCGSLLLSPSARGLLQQGASQILVQQLLATSKDALCLFSQRQVDTHTPDRPAAQPLSGWVQEMLTAVLQLADQLLHQQPPTPAETAAATPNAQGASSSSDSFSPAPPTAVPWPCIGSILALLWAVLGYSHSSRATLLRESRSSSGSGSVTVAVPAAASRFVEFAAAAEAALRAAMGVLHSGTAIAMQASAGVNAFCTGALLCHDGDNTQSVLVQHMGLCGPAALAQEQRQLYSFLSTVLKLGRGTTAAAQVCLGDVVASRCCWAVVQAAVGLLKVAAATGQQSESSAAAAAAAQQPAVDYLPSLVLFGRCCLLWAERLQQQTPELLWLVSGDRQSLQASAFLHEHSAALVCLPWLRAAVAMPDSKLEGLVDTVHEWVSDLSSPAALAQLGAAGCAPEQVQQQLLVLRKTGNGTLQEELTDACLAALVQQLQATGAMLTSIAVPHFCNNPACGNISGRTEVQLVSGRSCICAGCRTARYCGRACQRAAWKQHRPVCKALAAAAGVGAQA